MARVARSAIKVGEVAPLRRREHSVLQLRSAPFVERRAARKRAVVVPRSGGSFDESNAGESNFALERTAITCARCQTASPRRRSARALDRLIRSSWAARQRHERVASSRAASLPRRPVLSARALSESAVPVRRSASCRRWPAPSRRGSVGECRARLVEIKCQSGRGLRCCAGQVGSTSGGMRRAGSAIKVGEVAPLRQREHSVWQLRWAPFG